MFRNNRQVNDPLKRKESISKGFGVLKWILLVIVLFILASGSFYSIQEEEQAVVCTFGSPRAVTALQDSAYSNCDKGEYDNSGIVHRLSGGRRWGGRRRCTDDHVGL